LLLLDFVYFVTPNYKKNGIKIRHVSMPFYFLILITYSSFFPNNASTIIVPHIIAVIPILTPSFSNYLPFIGA